VAKYLYIFSFRNLTDMPSERSALGGAIGTGLFVGSGAILSLVGPAPLFMGYLSMMAIVYVVMNTLAEMVTYLPMGGITVPYFVGRFVDRSLAFATGWNYWYAYAILVAAESTAGSILLSYWVCCPDISVIPRTHANFILSFPTG
jgi:amino acid transporter